MATSSSKTLRIGYVPEHYLLPLHLCKDRLPPQTQLIPFPSGTGHMITSLRSSEIDLAIGLTEGWVAGLLNPKARAMSSQERGYSIIGSWCRNPLRWSIVTGRNRDDITRVSDLANHRKVGVSRIGSGSHIMAFVLAQQEGWLKEYSGRSSEDALELVPLGPFVDLRKGVIDGTADFFMWEHFTTKPWFDGESEKGKELKWVGEIYTPWPSWHVAARTGRFDGVDNNGELEEVFNAFDSGVKAFEGNKDAAVTMLGTGEAGCHYSEEDAREWLKKAEFFDRTRGVERGTMQSVVEVLKTAGVVGQDVRIEHGDGVVGIAR